MCYHKSLIKYNLIFSLIGPKNQKFTSDVSADIWRKFGSAPSHNPSIKKGGALISFESSSEKSLPLCDILPKSYLSLNGQHEFHFISWIWLDYTFSVTPLPGILSHKWEEYEGYYHFYTKISILKMKWLSHKDTWSIYNKNIIPKSFSISEFKMIQKDLCVPSVPVHQWLVRAIIWSWMDLKGLYAKGLVPNALVLIVRAARNLLAHKCTNVINGWIDLWIKNLILGGSI